MFCLSIGIYCQAIQIVIHILLVLDIVVNVWLITFVKFIDLHKVSDSVFFELTYIHLLDGH